MAYDLVIKNGVLVDGTGMPRYRADVAVQHGRIVSIGRIRERAREMETNVLFNLKNDR
jgi:N-acyl-D-aspartate/D-glutamate deacylase